MAANIYDWDVVAANNATADTDLTWAEGQAPSTVNNSARVMMQRGKQFLVDIGGSIAAGGTANALTLTAQSAFASLADGRIVSFKATATNTGAATINVNGIGAKAIMKPVEIGPAALIGGEIMNTSMYTAQYSTALNGGAGAWLLVNPTLPVPAWETVGVYTPSAAASVIITDLSASRFLRFSGFISNQTSAGPLVAQFSTNNGSSYDTAANYLSQDSSAASTTLTGSLVAAATGFVLSSNTNTVASSGFAFESSLFEFNKNSIVSGFSRSCPIIGAGRALVSVGAFHVTTTARNALRILNLNGGTISGTILVERMRG